MKDRRLPGLLTIPGSPRPLASVLGKLIGIDLGPEVEGRVASFI